MHARARWMILTGLLAVGAPGCLADRDLEGQASECGDGVCSADETAAGCPADCATTGPICGDGVCEAGEDAVSCAADCAGAGCGMGGATYTATLDFEEHFLDLDSGMVGGEVDLAVMPPRPPWDLQMAFGNAPTAHAVVFQAEGEVAIAHLPGRTFDSVTAADVGQASFTYDLIDEPFDAGRVVLIRTDRNGVYKLGESVEDSFQVTFSYAELVPAELPGTQVNCGPVKHAAIAYETALDLDMGMVVPCVQPCGAFDFSEEWDLHIAYGGGSGVHGVPFHNNEHGGQIALLFGRTFGSVTAADVPQATFQSELPTEPFVADLVLLLQTDTGAVFKIGNYVETDSAALVSFDFEQLVAPTSP